MAASLAEPLSALSADGSAAAWAVASALDADACRWLAERLGEHLQRGGLLYPAPEGWLLRPQGETFDLLLDRLPWSWGWVRLPWMADPLQVQW